MTKEIVVQVFKFVGYVAVMMPAACAIFMMGLLCLKFLMWFTKLINVP